MAFSSIRARSYIGPVAHLIVLFSCRYGFCCNSTSCSCQSVCPITCARQGAWFIAASPNFQVCSLESQAQAEQIAKHCESVRAEITKTWSESCGTWNPKCQIVLHQTTHDYVRAVGPGSDATLGSSLVKPAVGKIRARRIDLRTNVDDYLAAALPHEMCHVVMADRFRERPPPLWFDEGIALQYDPPAKQRLHERDLRLGLVQGDAFPLSELLTLERYPSADRWGVFYGQSASLVRWLLTQGTAQQLVRCVEQSQQEGISVALRENYGLQGWRDIPALAGNLSASSRVDPALQLVSVTTPPAPSK